MWARRPGAGQRPSSWLPNPRFGPGNASRLATGPYKRPERLPPKRTAIPIGPHIPPDRIVEAIASIIGGPEKVFELKTAAGFRYPVLVDAALLGRHLMATPDRTPYLPLLPELLRDPQEVWVTFERHKKTGKIALRVRLIKVLDTGKSRPLMLVLDARRGMAVSYTFLPYAMRKLNKVRVGWLLYGE